MPRIVLKHRVFHVPHGHVHPIHFEAGPQDVHNRDAETFLREGWADPLDAAAEAAPTPDPTPGPAAPSPDSGQAEPSSASPPAPASPKRSRKPAAKRKSPARRA